MKRLKLILSSLLIGVSASFVLAQTITYSSCPNPWAVCKVWGSYIRTVDPRCCQETSLNSSCRTVKADEWQCAFGGTDRWRDIVYHDWQIASSCQVDQQCL
jgi:hypothetical protein